MNNPSVNTLQDLQKDLAGTHKFKPIQRDVDPALVEQDWQDLQEQGYVMMKNLIPAKHCDQIKAELQPFLTHTGRNAFEGLKTQRIYSTLNKTRICDDLVTHPRILSLLDRLFMRNYLLSQLQVINILPGEEAQLIHHDDGFYPVPRPRAPLGAASIFAIDDFTSTNGATRLIPGSHKWGGKTPGPGDKEIPAVMPKGSAIFYGGTLWHGGGANRSDTSRLAITAQYCEPWLRQQENFMAGTDKNIVKTMSEELQSLLGYSILPPYIGMVDGVHPKRLLE
ncbi:MAG TPA: phytanoyl-CoA dioxygenase family protein [Hellea balneolensis]|uniref:Phytanoyl-CoA dioxygenase family protein n=1 Tax=Hellea balneolensis TaxID=287478 RepID=A0A7C5QWP6_9PROT|nr:phytanoyl-CoA dioxygenase family protein [Hellea balneolensis]